MNNLSAGQLFIHIRKELALNCSTEYFFDKINILSGKWLLDYVSPNCVECFTFIHLVERSYFLGDVEANYSHKEFSIFTNENIYLGTIENKSYFPICIRNRWPAELPDNFNTLTQRLDEAQCYDYSFPNEYDDWRERAARIDDELRKLAIRVVTDIRQARETFLNQFIENLD